VLLSFSILYYSFCTWSADRWYKNIGNLFLLILSGILLCGTKSASASLALSSATVIFIVLFVVFFRKLSLPSKYKGIVLTLLLILFSGTVILNQRGGIDDLQKLSEEITSNKQAKEDFTSSTGTRLIHLQSELKLIAHRPFIGYGTGSYGQAMKWALKHNQEKTYETRLWSEPEEYAPPPLNIYTRITVQNGLIGLIFFFLILAPVLVCWGKSYKKMKIEHWISLTLLCCVIAVIFCSVAVNLLYYLCLLVFPFYCFADMVFSEKNKP
jgi:O-antigen ligase